MSKDMQELFPSLSNRMKDNLKTGMILLWFGVGIVLPILWISLGVPIYHITYVESYCLEHKYKESRVTWLGKGYCVNRVDQTDVVVPLSEVK